MNYQIVQNEIKLKEFIEWLPVLEPGECYLVSLFSRKKYYLDPTGIKADKSQIKRFTSNKERLFDKIKQLEIALDGYMADGIPIPQETLALYITVNPRSYIKAGKENLKELCNLITMDKYNGYNPHKLALNCIQKSCGRKIYLDFDFDNSDVMETLERVKEIMNPDAISVIKSRGGLHLLLELGKIAPEYVKSFHRAMTKIPGYDAGSKPEFVPVPGCLQGGAVPVLYTDFKK